MSVLALAHLGCTVHEDDWAREFGTALCRHEQKCRKVSASVDCSRPGFWSPLPEELEARREGLVGYSPADARRCIDLLSKVGCIDYVKSRLFASAECRAAFPGQLAEGEGCMRRQVATCGRDLTCKEPGAAPWCGSCVPTAPEGEEVMRGVRKDCSFGLYGVTDGGGWRVCLPRPSLGEPCSFRQPCLEWLDCSSPFDGGTCVNGPAPLDAGEGEPGEGCRVVPTGIDPIGLFFGDGGWSQIEWCAWPATCEESRCVDRSARLGESCRTNSQCDSFAACRVGVCAEAQQEGQPCAPRCTDSLLCLDGVCQTRRSVCP